MQDGIKKLEQLDNHEDIKNYTSIAYEYYYYTLINDMIDNK